MFPSTTSPPAAGTAPVGLLADLAARGIDLQSPHPPGANRASAPRDGAEATLVAEGRAGPARTLAELEADVARLLGGFRSERCTGAQAAEVVAATGRIIRLVEAAQLRALDRVDETGAWRGPESRSLAGWTMRTLDCTFHEARARAECAVQLRSQPHIARLAAGGDVPLDKVILAAATTAERPDAGREVAAAAKTHDRRAFKVVCRRIRQAGETDEDRAERQRRNRRATTSIDDEGMFDFHAIGPASEGAELQSLFQPWVDDALREAWALGLAPTGAQARWDALMAMARAAAEPVAEPPTVPDAPDPVGSNHETARQSGRRGSTGRRRPAGLARGRGSRVKVIVRVDLTALLRGRVLPGEICDLSGAGDIDVAAVRQLIADGAFLTAVVAPTGDPPDGSPPTGSPPTITRVAPIGRVSPESDLVPPPGNQSTGIADPDRPLAFLDALLDQVEARGQDVDDLVHDHRSPNAAQRSVLEFLHPVCSVPGCTMACGLEIDHIAPWIDTRETALADLDRKCHLHHAEKTRRENAERAARRRNRTERSEPLPPSPLSTPTTSDASSPHLAGATPAPGAP